MPATIPITNSPLDRGMTAGKYLRACRRRAGMSHADVAEIIARRCEDRLYAETDLARLERDDAGDFGPLLAALERHRPFPFDLGAMMQPCAATADFEAEAA